MGEIVSLAERRTAAENPVPRSRGAAMTARKNPAPHHANALSFMRIRKPKGTGTDHWVVEGTGGYGSDCERGSLLGDEYLAFVGTHPTYGNATLLGCIVNDMMVRNAGGHLSGIEIAFLARVNEYAMATAATLTRA